MAKLTGNNYICGCGVGGNLHCYDVYIDGDLFTIKYDSNKYHHTSVYRIINKNKVELISGYQCEPGVVQSLYNKCPDRLYNIDIMPKYNRRSGKLSGIKFENVVRTYNISKQISELKAEWDALEDELLETEDELKEAELVEAINKILYSLRMLQRTK